MLAMTHCEHTEYDSGPRFLDSESTYYSYVAAMAKVVHHGVAPRIGETDAHTKRAAQAVSKTPFLRLVRTCSRILR